MYRRCDDPNAKFYGCLLDDSGQPLTHDGEVQLCYEAILNSTGQRRWMKPQGQNSDRYRYSRKRRKEERGARRKRRKFNKLSWECHTRNPS